MASGKTNPRILALFDVDGTLTAARKVVKPDMTEQLNALRKKITIGVVGGSDLAKQKEQLGDNVLQEFDYNFPENGLVAFKNGQLVKETSFKEHMGEEKIKKLVNFIMLYLAQVDIPVKRGTFIEFRKGMLNVSPVGRNCSQEERDAFEQYDKIHNVRSTMVKVLQTQFAEYNLQYSIGGQISFDVFPKGWDKTFCLRFLPEDQFDEIHFFGDKTYEGGNDYEIFHHPRTKGHTVTCPEDTMKFLNELFN